MTDLKNDSNFNNCLDAWHTAVKNAEYWKNQELTLRNEIFGTAFPNPTPGTNKIRIAHDMALIGDHRINYRIDQPGLDAGRSLIPAQIFDAVIGYTPRVRDAAYRKLSDDDRKLFSDFITEKPGTPGIEIKPASKVRW